MKIYRNLENKKLYIIDRLILDIKKLNKNADAGIYAKPYKWQGETIVYKSKDEDKCKIFVKQNFLVVAEL